MDIQNAFDLMYTRPSEPIFVPKGEGKEAFEVGEVFLIDEYKDIGMELTNRFGESDKIPLQEPSITPDLRFADVIKKSDNFSTFSTLHLSIAAKLIDIFMGLPLNQPQDFIAVAAYIRDRVNAKLFNYSLSVAILHRTDMKNVKLPNFMESFPSNFVDGSVFQDARENAALVPVAQRANVPITIPRDFTASDLEPEHRLAYWREDIGVNLHHWHWHLVYPFSVGNRNINIVNKDRRGELFYYMHNQLLARFNSERLCNSLARVKKHNNFRALIPEAYYSKLDNITASRSWPPRQANMSWQDLNREVDGIKLPVDDLMTWRSRIEDAISKGRARNNQNQEQTLTIDLLGNMVEASDISINRNYYGTLHNSGHNLTAYIHDPDNRYLESFGVMADEATAMRDPFFYRWHAFLDELFQKHKATLSPYLRAELDYPDVRITDINVNPTQAGGRVNRINTYWMQSVIDLSRGLDFADRGAVYTRFTHLNHQPFTYSIKYRNTGAPRFATCRIFLAPKFDERGLPWQLADQRTLFIEMDRFVVQLQNGDNIINQNSTDSSVTIPFERTFRDLSGSSRDFANAQQASFNFCGCGWPQHMLVPKGSIAGHVFQLFVMLSNYNLDSVNQDIQNIPCSDASSFCGIKDRLYPDRRAMGYPFDRPPSTASVIDQFLTPNMGIREVTIVHNDVTVQNPRNPRAVSS